MSKHDYAQRKMYLYDTAKRFNLVEFVEREAQVKLSSVGGRWSCLCPLHADSMPSFVVFESPDGMWFYKCFGCGSGGTIIDFCMAFFSLESAEEALLKVAERMNLNLDEDFIAKAITEAKASVDMRKAMESEHIAAATACRTLMRSHVGNQKVMDWTDEAYRKMNQFLQDGNTDGINLIAREASRLMSAGIP